jgi:hypothetical protein
VKAIQPVQLPGPRVCRMPKPAIDERLPLQALCSPREQVSGDGRAFGPVRRQHTIIRQAPRRADSDDICVSVDPPGTRTQQIKGVELC